VVRYTADGSIAPEFQRPGTGTLALPQSNFTAAVTPNGQLVVGGRSERDDLFYRYNTDGGRDMTFGTGGSTETGKDGLPNPGLLNELVQGDGHVIGYQTDQGQTGNGIAIHARRLNPDGTQDPSYNDDIGTADGVQVSSLPGGWVFFCSGDYRSGTLIRPDGRRIGCSVPVVNGDEYTPITTTAAFPIGTTGKIVVTGSVGQPNGTMLPIIAVRLSNGSLDTKFNGTGYLWNVTGVVGAQRDGKILLRAGATGLKRLNSSGSKDSTFGTGGIAASGYATFDYDNLDRIIARKTLSNGDVQIARFTPDGRVDTTFGGGDGIVVVHPAVSSGAITLLITPNNDLVLTSLKQTTSTAQWFATKLKGGGFADIASGKLLIVSGSTGNDSTSVSATSSTLSVKVNGATQSFSKSAVSSIRVNGFGGDDTINVGNGVGNVLMNGDDGNDVLLGGNGNDTLIGGRGSDTLSGGSGNDTADYSAATSNLAIDQDNVADDGIAGENDNVRDDIETILGGSGNDRLIGGPSANLIRGGSGNDTIYGGAGNDSLDGGPGHDKLYGEVGNDTLFAKDGQTDTLDGGNGYDKAQRDNSTTIKDQVLNIESFI
jgi:uncharacterized delta-60 repeat protein